MTHRVLIVDDDEDTARVLANWFLRDKCDVVVATSGHQALEMVRYDQFDFVLLDMMMPDADGLTVLRELKRLRPEIASHVAILSARKPDANEEKTLQDLGGTWMVKNFESEGMNLILAKTRKESPEESEEWKRCLDELRALCQELKAERNTNSLTGIREFNDVKTRRR